MVLGKQVNAQGVAARSSAGGSTVGCRGEVRAGSLEKRANGRGGQEVWCTPCHGKGRAENWNGARYGAASLPLRMCPQEAGRKRPLLLHTRSLPRLPGVVLQEEGNVCLACPAASLQWAEEAPRQPDGGLRQREEPSIERRHQKRRRASPRRGVVLLLAALRLPRLGPCGRSSREAA